MGDTNMTTHHFFKKKMRSRLLQYAFLSLDHLWKVQTRRSPSRKERMKVWMPFLLKLKSSVLWLCNNKSIGMDGFAMTFLQDNWDCIKEDLWKVFTKFFMRCIIDSGMCQSQVCLIHEKDKAIQSVFISFMKSLFLVFKEVQK